MKYRVLKKNIPECFILNEVENKSNKILSLTLTKHFESKSKKL